jgi:hypothetical protein
MIEIKFMACNDPLCTYPPCIEDRKNEKQKCSIPNTETCVALDKSGQSHALSSVGEALNEMGYELAVPKCEWKREEFDGDYFESSCGKAFFFTIDGPKENNYKYCPCCGKEIEEKKLMKIEVTLEYKKSIYKFIDDFEYDEFPDFYWTEGNMSCDCNRSQYIRDYCTSDFPPLLCGDEINLIEMTEVNEEKKDAMD